MEDGPGMDFSLSFEQRMLVDSTRQFTEEVLYPREDEVEASDRVSPELKAWVISKAQE